MMARRPLPHRHANPIQWRSFARLGCREVLVGIVHDDGTQQRVFKGLLWLPDEDRYDRQQPRFIAETGAFNWLNGCPPKDQPCPPSFPVAAREGDLFEKFAPLRHRASKKGS